MVLLGSGFDPAAQVGCPALVPTTFVSSSELRCTVPDMEGQPGQSIVVSVYVQNADGSQSGTLPFTVQFPLLAQSFTTVAKVAAQVPGFKRGGRIGDDTIQEWIAQIAGSIRAVFVRRGLSLSPSDWAEPDPASAFTPGAVLDLINCLGAAAQLAAAIAADFTSGEWGLSKRLDARYQAEMKTLEDGGYDKLFSPSVAVTEEIGPQFAAGDVTNDEGEPDNAFGKDQVF